MKFKKKNNIVPEKKVPVKPLIFFDQEERKSDEAVQFYHDDKNKLHVTQSNYSMYDNINSYYNTGLEDLVNKTGPVYELFEKGHKNGDNGYELSYNFFSENLNAVKNNITKQVLDLIYSVLYTGAFDSLNALYRDINIDYNKAIDVHNLSIRISDFIYYLEYSDIKDVDINNEYIIGNCIMNFAPMVLNTIMPNLFNYVRDIVYQNELSSTNLNKDMIWISIQDLLNKDFVKIRDAFPVIETYLINMIIRSHDYKNMINSKYN